MLEEWPTDSCKKFLWQMITSDARALQNLLKMKIFELRGQLLSCESDKI